MSKNLIPFPLTLHWPKEMIMSCPLTKISGVEISISKDSRKFSTVLGFFFQGLYHFKISRIKLKNKNLINELLSQHNTKH